VRTVRQPAMSAPYYRSTSPGSRRIQNPARMSDSFTPEQYYAARNAYASPRTSGERVVPISTQTFVNGRPLEKVYETHGRQRRSTVNESQRQPITVSTAQSSSSSNRNRPTVIQATPVRPASPVSRPREERDGGYYSPSTASAPRTHHKKIYSVDDGKSKLVADIDMTKGRARRPSVDRSGNPSARRNSVDRSAAYTVADQGRRNKEYHLSGPIRSKEPTYDEHSYSYTDPASMYRETEPRWRPRRGSVDGSRERPQSMVLDSYTRPAVKEPGPPPSSRGLDRLNEGYGISRSNSSRQPPRSAHRTYEDAGYASQDEYRAPRVRTTNLTVPAGDYGDQVRSPNNRQSVAIVQDRPIERAEPTPISRDVTPVVREAPRERYYEDRRDPAPRYDERRDRVDDRREPRAAERPAPASRHQDASVERRGFGIRAGSQDRFGPQRSDESFERPQYEARPPPPPEPREYARRDPPRTEPERRDYHAEDLGRKERDRPRDEPVESRRRDRDDYRDDRDDYKESHRSHRDRDDDQTRYRDYDRDDRDRVDRHEDHRRRHKDPYDSSLGSMLPAAMGAAGLGAAAIYGTNEVTKNKEQDRASVSPPDNDDRERRRRRDRDREPDVRQDLPPSSLQTPAAVAVPPPPPVEREPEREPNRSHIDDRDEVADKSSAAYDAEEEYRRRLQQAQQEASRPRPEIMPGSFESAPPSEVSHDSGYQRREEPRYEKQTNFDEAPPPRQLRRQGSDEANYSTDSAGADSVLDRSFDGQAEIIDNSASSKRENRVRIVEPPNEREPPVDRPRGILKTPTNKFPEHPNSMREGVAPLKDVSSTALYVILS